MPAWKIGVVGLLVWFLVLLPLRGLVDGGMPYPSNAVVLLVFALLDGVVIGCLSGKRQAWALAGIVGLVYFLAHSAIVIVSTSSRWLVTGAPGSWSPVMGGLAVILTGSCLGGYVGQRIVARRGREAIAAGARGADMLRAAGFVLAALAVWCVAVLVSGSVFAALGRYSWGRVLAQVTLDSGLLGLALAGIAPMRRPILWGAVAGLVLGLVPGALAVLGYGERPTSAGPWAESSPIIWLAAAGMAVLCAVVATGGALLGRQIRENLRRRRQ